MRSLARLKGKVKKLRGYISRQKLHTYTALSIKISILNRALKIVYRGIPSAKFHENVNCRYIFQD